MTIDVGAFRLSGCILAVLPAGCGRLCNRDWQCSRKHPEGHIWWFGWRCCRLGFAYALPSLIHACPTLSILFTDWMYLMYQRHAITPHSIHPCLSVTRHQCAHRGMTAQHVVDARLDRVEGSKGWHKQIGRVCVLIVCGVRKPHPTAHGGRLLAEACKPVSCRQPSSTGSRTLSSTNARPFEAPAMLLLMRPVAPTIMLLWPARLSKRNGRATTQLPKDSPGGLSGGTGRLVGSIVCCPC